MNMIGVLIAVVVLLTGCEQNFFPTDERNVIALANTQRHEVIQQTRAAAYLVYPDTPDPSVLEDETFLEAAQVTRATGTAVGVSDDGLVFTNAHVVMDTYCTAAGHPAIALRKEKKQETYCTLFTQTYKRAFRARLIHLDEVEDVAVLRIEGVVAPLPHLKIAEWGTFTEGAEVLTVGSPLGNENFTTVGHISNLDFIKADDEKKTKRIRFNANIQPGNSGGALVDVATGKIVGLVFAVVAARVINPNGGVTPISTNIAFAVRADVLTEILHKIQQK